MLSPHDLEALGALGDPGARATRNRPAESGRSTHRRLHARPRPRASHLTRLGESLEKGDPDSALPLFRSALDIDPGQPGSSPRVVSPRGPQQRIRGPARSRRARSERAQRSQDGLRTLRACCARRWRRRKRRPGAGAALELDPESTAAACDLRACLARTGDIDRLTELLARAANSCVDKPTRPPYGDRSPPSTAIPRATWRAPSSTSSAPCAGTRRPVRAGRPSPMCCSSATASSPRPRACSRASRSARATPPSCCVPTELAFLYEEHLNHPATAIHHLRAAVKPSPSDSGLLLRLSISSPAPSTRGCTHGSPPTMELGDAAGSPRRRAPAHRARGTTARRQRRHGARPVRGRDRR